MNKFTRFLFWIILLAVVIKGGMWGYENFIAGSKPVARKEVLDIDKDCRMDADSGQCICRHRQTGERLSIGYGECTAIARGD